MNELEADPSTVKHKTAFLVIWYIHLPFHIGGGISPVFSQHLNRGVYRLFKQCAHVRNEIHNRHTMA